MPAPPDLDPEKGCSRGGGPSSHPQDLPSQDPEHHEPHHMGPSSVSDDSGTEHDHDHHHDHQDVDTHPKVTQGGIAPAGDVPMVTEDVSGLNRTTSRSSSTRPGPLVIVPRHKRRGLFARFAIVPEVEQPYDYKNSTKWGITLTVSIATAAAPLGSSIFYPALPTMTQELNTTETITNLSVAMYMLSMSIFPIWWSAFSEQFGRRTIYLISFALFTISSILCAVSTNIAMLIVFRICSGGASASVQAVGAGTIADIWETKERGRAMGLFYLGPLTGPLLAPIVGGALAQAFGWQSTMWFLAIFGLIITVLLLFLLPETLAQKPEVIIPVEPQTQELKRMRTTDSVKVHTKKTAANIKRFLFDPLKVLLFLRFPPVLITVIIAAVAFGALFVQNISIQQKFSAPPYSFPKLIVGLMYIPSGLGYFVTSFFGGKWIDSIMAREARKANRYDSKGRLILLPEDRMRENMWLASVFYPLGLLMFGWTLEKGIMWIAPAIGAFIFGVTSMLVFAVSTTMLTEFVRKNSSAGVAVNNFVRNLLSCLGTVVAAPWVIAWGAGWVFTAICFFCMIVGLAGMWSLRMNATKWRKEMDRVLEQED